MRDDGKRSGPGLTEADLAKLTAPFPDEKIRVKVQCLNRDKTRAMLVCYVSHWDVAERLDEVDPNWESHIVDTPQFHGEYCTLQMRLTIKGVSRENAGEGQDSKAAASDALKRCAMSFGVNRDRYDGERVWVPYNDARDSHRVWTLDDYIGGMREERDPPRTARSSKPSSAYGRDFRPEAASKQAPPPIKLTPKTKPALIAEIRQAAEQLGLADEELEAFAQEHSGVHPGRMTVTEMQAFLGALNVELRKAGIST